MKGEWEHAICVLCWYRKTGDKTPTTHRLPSYGVKVETCCYCGRETVAGFYVREDPATVHKEEVRGNG